MTGHEAEWNFCARFPDVINFREQTSGGVAKWLFFLRLHVTVMRITAMITKQTGVDHLTNSPH